MERLTGLDAAFLYMETPTTYMHVASTTIFDPSSVEGGYSFQRVKRTVEQRLHLLPPFRRRLIEVPFGLHHPIWVDDPDFDLDYHIRRAALPSPGGMRELAEFSADIVSRPLDRRRPLWEMWLVEGLEGGYVASVAKVHHAAVDGVSGVELTAVLLDLEPEADVDGPEEPFEADRIPSDVEMLAYAVTSLSRQPWRIARSVARTARAALRLGARNAFGPTGGAERRKKDPPPAPFTAPRTILNGSIGPRRQVAFTSVSLGELKAIKDAFDVKLNDVILAACAGALRQFLSRLGDLPSRPLVAFVPISVRSADDQDVMGNQVSAMLVSLATDESDSAARLTRIAASSREGKRQHDTVGATTLTDWAEFAAPAVFSQAARLYSTTRLAERHRPAFNVVISNVPGPQFPLYFAGAELVGLYPMGPIVEGGAVNITVMSYRGEVFFGLVGCRDAVPDIWELATDIEDEVAGLHKAAGAEA